MIFPIGNFDLTIIIMGINLTGWVVNCDEPSTFCTTPELECPIKIYKEEFMGHYWSEWTTNKVDIPFQDQINTVVECMESTYSDSRPGFAFTVEEVEKFKQAAAELQSKCVENIRQCWL